MFYGISTIVGYLILNTDHAYICGVMVKAMDCGIVVSEFELLSRYYVFFRENTLGKSMNDTYPPCDGLNSTSTVVSFDFFVQWHIKYCGLNPLSSLLWVRLYHDCSSRRIALALNSLQRLICH